MKHFVYLIKSESYNWYYVGMSSDVFGRLKEHNAGRVRSTRARRPYRVIWFKEYGTRAEARDKEKKYKISSQKDKLIKKYGGFSSAG